MYFFFFVLFLHDSTCYSVFTLPVMMCLYPNKNFQVVNTFHIDVIFCRFSTGSGVTGGSALIHDFYSREITNPVHLIVDTGFSNGGAAIKAFVSVGLSLGDQLLAAQFQEIQLDLRMVEAEHVGCRLLCVLTYICLLNLLAL